jgi:hypothetical protein
VTGQLSACVTDRACSSSTQQQAKADGRNNAGGMKRLISALLDTLARRASPRERANIDVLGIRGALHDEWYKK